MWPAIPGNPIWFHLPDNFFFGYKDNRCMNLSLGHFYRWKILSNCKFLRQQPKEIKGKIRNGLKCTYASKWILALIFKLQVLACLRYHTCWKTVSNPPLLLSDISPKSRFKLFANRGAIHTRCLGPREGNRVWSCCQSNWWWWTLMSGRRYAHDAGHERQPT